MSQYAMTQKRWCQMMVFSLLGMFFIFFVPMDSVGGEKYVKTDLCEIDLNECQLGRINPFLFDVDEKDRVFYFDEDKHELDVFSKGCKIEKKIVLDKTFERTDFDYDLIRLQVRNEKAVIYPRWYSTKTHYVDLATGKQKTVVAEVVTHGQCVYFDGRIINYETGETIQTNPFEQPKGLRIGGRLIDVFREKRVEGIDATIKTLAYKGESKRTKPVYGDGFFYVCIEKVDVEGNIYVSYKKRTVVESDVYQETENGGYIKQKDVVCTYMLLKFNNNMEEIFRWVGRDFYINAETMNVYVLQLNEKNAKFEKWALDK